jgi:hypothetical protein
MSDVFTGPIGPDGEPLLSTVSSPGPREGIPLPILKKYNRERKR